MTYTKVNAGAGWDESTPVSAANLDHMDEGIESAHDTRVDKSGDTMTGTLVISQAGANALTSQGQININRGSSTHLGFQAGGTEAGRIWRDGGMLVITAQLPERDNHASVKIQTVVAGNTAEVQARNHLNTAFRPMRASDFIVASDPATKRDIEPADRMLDVIRGVAVATYRRVDGQARHIGLLADDPALPDECVVADPETGEGGVNVTDVVGMLVKAVQDLAGEVDDLRARLDG